jgi:hypothetical protein
MNLNRISILIFILFLSSCKNSTDVVSHSFLQKRKYQRGWHIESNHKFYRDREANEKCLTSAASVKADSLPELLHGSQTETLEEVEVTPIGTVIKEMVQVGSIDVYSADKSSDHSDFGLKKKMKRRKERITAQTRVAQSVSALSTWGYDWPFYKNFIGITLSVIGILLTILALTNLKKNQKRNRRFCILFLVANVLFIVVFGIMGGG